MEDDSRQETNNSTTYPARTPGRGLRPRILGTESPCASHRPWPLGGLGLSLPPSAGERPVHSGRAPSSRWSVPRTQHPPCLRQAGGGGGGGCGQGWEGPRMLAGSPRGDGAPALRTTLCQAGSQVSLQKTQVTQ